jgi:hypothetical protein
MFGQVGYSIGAARRFFLEPMSCLIRDITILTNDFVGGKRGVVLGKIAVASGGRFEVASPSTIQALMVTEASSIQAVCSGSSRSQRQVD